MVEQSHEEVDKAAAGAACRPSHVRVSELLAKLGECLPAHSLATLQLAAASFARIPSLSAAQSRALLALFAAAAPRHVLSAALASPPLLPPASSPPTPTHPPVALPVAWRCLDPTHRTGCPVCVAPPGRLAVAQRTPIPGTGASPLPFALCPRV